MVHTVRTKNIFCHSPVQYNFQYSTTYGCSDGMSRSTVVTRKLSFMTNWVSLFQFMLNCYLIFSLFFQSEQIRWTIHVEVGIYRTGFRLNGQVHLFL